MNSSLTPYRRKVWTLTTGPSQSLYEDVYKVYKEVVEKIPDGAVLHCTVQPIGALGVKVGKDKGNILGLEGVPQSCKYHSLSHVSSSATTKIKC